MAGWRAGAAPGSLAPANIFQRISIPASVEHHFMPSLLGVKQHTCSAVAGFSFFFFVEKKRKRKPLVYISSSTKVQSKPDCPVVVDFEKEMKRKIIIIMFCFV